jgi:hypothetical protein
MTQKEICCAHQALKGKQQTCSPNVQKEVQQIDHDHPWQDPMEDGLVFHSWVVGVAR